MPSYKLTYFNGRGRAEVSRWLFALGNQEYQDERLVYEEWLKVKQNTPFGQLPVLIVDEVQISQGNAIARLLAKRFGFLGKTDLDEAKINMIVDSIDDLRNPLLTIMFQTPDEDKKAELRKKYNEETLPGLLSKFEKLVEAQGFFVGDSTTLADVAFSTAAANIPDIPLDKYPKLKALKEKVETIPAIKAWIAKRPETQF